LVVYTVHEPPNAWGDPIDRATRLVFVKDGFHWLAALFPAIWLLVKGLWLELIVFLVAVAVMTWGLEAAGASPTLSGFLLLAVQIIFGFEACTVYAAALERRGWRMAGTITGRDEADCERRFFETWLPSQPELPAGAAPAQPGPVTSWTETMWRNAKDAIARGRRLSGAKA
jgi:hypothetical protein